MIIKLSKKWADWLVQNSGQADDYEVYAYGAECMLNELLSDLLLIVSALLLNKTFEMLLWMVFFTPLRMHLGGIHASSHLKCIFSSFLLSYLCIFTYPLIINFPAIMALLLAISVFIVFKIAPVVHPNHPVSESRKDIMRIRAITIILIEIILICIAYRYMPIFVAGVATVSVFSVCLLAMAGKFYHPVLSH
ncbi:MAG: accessory gene regulator B family protein [Epulopiscium sp.]|jgi:accessory gene regulator B|nr:accessory gene regulator B family protein [Candidatus Epulonipiscium sp.]